ncbi:hypothetical protein ABZ383_14500 [Streptomyces sp. NPDC005900]|uniref:hypothetical protein n=1 Tax=Streptomyces sp. NPDC005900 TaxID=3154569 RepID=UPI0033CB576B
MTARRALGAGPQVAPGIRAAEADLSEALPGIRLPDLAELRARGVLDARLATTPAPRRVLRTGSRASGDPDR